MSMRRMATGSLMLSPGDANLSREIDSVSDLPHVHRGQHIRVAGFTFLELPLLELLVLALEPFPADNCPPALWEWIAVQCVLQLSDDLCGASRIAGPRIAQ